MHAETLIKISEEIFENISKTYIAKIVWDYIRMRLRDERGAGDRPHLPCRSMRVQVKAHDDLIALDSVVGVQLDAGQKRLGHAQVALRLRHQTGHVEGE